MTGPATSALMPLPIQIRPVAGEGAKSFIKRLATANHLKAAALRSFLCEPPMHQGSPQWRRLAAVTRREPSLLQEILENTRCAECGALLPLSPASSCQQRPCSPDRLDDSTGPQHLKPRKQSSLACGACRKKLITSALDGTQRWCSSTCHRKGQRRQSKEAEDQPTPGLAWKSGSPEISFFPRGGEKRWCSKRCNRRASLRNRLARENATLPWPCDHCGATLKAGRGQEGRRTCSNSCRQKLYYRRRKARLNQEPR